MTKQQKAIDYFDGYGSPYDDYLIDLLERDMPRQVRKRGHGIKSVPCPKCGKWLLKVENFCQHCGQRLEETK